MEGNRESLGRFPGPSESAYPFGTSLSPVTAS